jgi:hypothetical protein
VLTLCLVSILVHNPPVYWYTTLPYTGTSYHET